MTRELQAVAERMAVRLLLVRRPAGQHRVDPVGRTLFRVDCRRGNETVLVRHAGPGELAAAAADSQGWTRHHEPLLLVCTHGRKDWCCALRGRPVAAALSGLAHEETWECSHVGGDRFAANVIAMPSGVGYGQLTPGDAAPLVAAVRSGRVLPDRMRGRCVDAMVVQAADVHARVERGLDGLDDLAPTAVERDGDQWRVRFAIGAGGGDLLVLVRAESAPQARLLTCGAAQGQHPRRWQLLDVRQVTSLSS